jgi:hypothetical protein
VNWIHTRGAGRGEQEVYEVNRKRRSQTIRQQVRSSVGKCRERRTGFTVQAADKKLTGSWGRKMSRQRKSRQ